MQTLSPKLRAIALSTMCLAAISSARTSAQKTGTDGALVRTKVRVVDAQRRGVQGARVFAISRPLPHLPTHLEQILVEAKSDARGHAKLMLDPTRLWCVWASYRTESTRSASVIVRGAQPGRPVRLTLLQIDVQEIQVKGLDDWRKLVPTARVVFEASPIEEWLGYTGRSPSFRCPVPEFSHRAPGFISPIFDGETVAGKPGRYVVPPMPYGFYYVHIVDADGAWLDSRWLAHVFPTGQEKNKDYDRKEGRKTVDVSKPPVREIRVLDQSGKPVRGASLVAQSTLWTNVRGRAVQANNEGVARMIFPAAYREVPATIALWSFDPRCPPSSVQLQATKAGSFRVSRLPVEQSHRVVNAQPGDRFRAFAPRLGFLPGGCEVRPDKDGRLPLPYRSGGHCTLFAIRKERARILRVSSADAKASRIDLGSMRDTRIQVRVAGDGRAARGGFVEIHAGATLDIRSVGLRVPIDRAGLARTKLMPGDYWMLAWSPKGGDGWKRVSIRAEEEGAALVELSLRPFRELRAQVQDPSRDAPRKTLVILTASAVASQQGAPGGTTPTIAARLVSFSNTEFVCDALGRHTVRLSASALRADFLAYDLEGASAVQVRTTWTSRSADAPVAIRFR